MTSPSHTGSRKMAARVVRQVRSSATRAKRRRPMRSRPIFAAWRRPTSRTAPSSTSTTGRSLSVFQRFTLVTMTRDRTLSCQTFLKANTAPTFGALVPVRYRLKVARTRLPSVGFRCSSRFSVLQRCFLQPPTAADDDFLDFFSLQMT